MKRSERCEGGYCQLGWLVLLLPGMTLLMFHGNQFGQSNLRGIIWLSSHPVINNISCCMAQPCWRRLLQCDTKSLWPAHLLQWRSQTDQFHHRRYGASMQWYGITIQHDQFNCERFGAFTIVEGCGPVTYCGDGLVVALHGMRNPNAAYQCTRSLVLVGRCSLSTWFDPGWGTFGQMLVFLVLNLR